MTKPFLNYTIVFLALIVSFSCQEDTISVDQDFDQLELEDQDMIAAIAMADEFLANSNERQIKARKSVTVLKFKDGKLLFHTNTDKGGGYIEVDEQTVTATVTNGSNIFWYSGGGVTDLEGIEFDEDSQMQLVELPMETNTNKMWMVTVKSDEDDEDEDDEDTYLKYDIIYKAKGSNSIIRLDPKIKISQ